MRKLNFILYSAFLLGACRHVEPKADLPTSRKWSEDSIRQYFKDSIAQRQYNGHMGIGQGINNFDTFSKYVLADIKAKNISDAYILGFNEPYIDTTRIDSTKKWIRISVNPCFRTPYCLILEQSGETSTLTLKMTDGHGGYYSGYLNFVSTERHFDSLYFEFSKRLHQINFWQIKDNEHCLGFDGEDWTFEAMENGQYNIVTRWLPLHCGNDVTRKLALIAIDLRTKSKFKNYIRAKTNMTTKEIDMWYPDK